MHIVTPNTEFIIGIDFGHGETSAAFIDINNGKMMDLDILPGQKTIKSAVAILEQEGARTICIGDAAIDNAPEAKDFQVSFKKLPSKMNPEEKKRMEDFMRGVYASILERHPDFVTRKHVVYIARPSQDKIWKAEERLYVEMAEKAGLPVAGIQKESRAAYFRARTQPNAKIDGYVRDGVLIVDFGSSTIDFTYLNLSLKAPIDDGCNLGANAVETILMEYAMETLSDPDMQEFRKRYGKDKSSNAYNQLLFAFRKAKEEFYSHPNKPVFSVVIDFALLTSYEEHPLNGLVRFLVPRKDVNTILENSINGSEVGYIESIRRAVRNFKETKLKDHKVACVYLTGGASRMDFVRNIFMEIFDLDANHCPSDDNPSLIVSQGVAHLSYADFQTKDAEDRIRRIAKEIIDAYDWKGNLMPIIEKITKERIICETKDVMEKWRDNYIWEKMEIKGGCAPTGEYLYMEGAVPDGPAYVRNIRTLRAYFKSRLESLRNYDIAQGCVTEITQTIIYSILEELKKGLNAFSYEHSQIGGLSFRDFSAKISPQGIKELTDRLTGEGSGHIVYDAVKDRYDIMVGWNLIKDRGKEARQRHYDYFMAHNVNIYSDISWNLFLKKNIEITGLENIKHQTEKFVDGLIDEYISYARLAIFFH